MTLHSSIQELSQNFDSYDTVVGDQGKSLAIGPMEEHFVESSLKPWKTKIFHYPARRGAGEAVFVLKGLYGAHDPKGLDWDNALCDLLVQRSHVILINTGRHPAAEREAQFAGKTFEDECRDVLRAFTFCKESVLPRGLSLNAVAMSFGGTLLSGLPAVLQHIDTVTMIGSGCGRSKTTRRPLLESMPQSRDLLYNVSEFGGDFLFLRGGRDETVPVSSQLAIFNSAVTTRSRAWVEFRDLDHKLSGPAGSRLADLAYQHFKDLRGRSSEWPK